MAPAHHCVQGRRRRPSKLVRNRRIQRKHSTGICSDSRPDINRGHVGAIVLSGGELRVAGVAHCQVVAYANSDECQAGRDNGHRHNAPCAQAGHP